MKSTGTLGWLDYVVLAVFLVISLGIGVYHALTGGRQRTTEEFIMGNRRLGIIPTAVSLFVSLKTALFMIGMTAEMYMYGIQILVWLPVGYAVGLVLTERLAIPLIYSLRLVSINDVSYYILQGRGLTFSVAYRVFKTRNENSSRMPASRQHAFSYGDAWRSMPECAPLCIS